MSPVRDGAVLPAEPPRATAMAFSPPAPHKYIHIYIKIDIQSLDPTRHLVPVDPDLGILRPWVQHRWRWCHPGDNGVIQVTPTRPVMPRDVPANPFYLQRDSNRELETLAKAEEGKTLGAP